MAPLGGAVVLVYIAEAHAYDVWPINSSRHNGPGNTVASHKTQGERATAALRMRTALELEEVPLLCDAMDDAFLQAYAAWPIRFYGVRGGRLEVIAQPHAASFVLPPLREWLLEACGDGQ